MRIDEAAGKIIRELQGDLPLVAEPYRIIAERAGLTETEVTAIVAELQRSGLLRRVGAVLRHQLVGYDVNAMIAWKVAEDTIEDIGHLMSSHPRVSHCYWRETPPDWPFPLFTMIHARSREEMEGIVKELQSLSGVTEYKVIESVREFKKTSVRYL